jgi:hypothetical protein
MYNFRYDLFQKLGMLPLLMYFLPPSPTWHASNTGHCYVVDVPYECTVFVRSCWQRGGMLGCELEVTFRHYKTGPPFFFGLFRAHGSNTQNIQPFPNFTTLPNLGLLPILEDPVHPFLDPALTPSTSIHNHPATKCRFRLSSIFTSSRRSTRT